MKVAVTAVLVLALGCKDKEQKSSIELPEPEEHVPPPGAAIVDPNQMQGPERPASVTDMHMALIERLADVAVQAEKVVRDHTGDCAATAAALAAITAKSASDVATTQEQLTKLTAGDTAADAYIEYRLEMERTRGIEVIALLDLCKGSKQVAAAVAGIMPLLGEGEVQLPPTTDGWTGAHPPGVTDAQVKAIDAMGTWFEWLSAAAEKSKGDCAAMAKALQPQMAKGKELAKRAEDSQKDVASKSPESEWLGQYTARTVDMKRFILALGPCQKDKAVQQALEAMNP